MRSESENRPPLVDRIIARLMQPKNLARIFRWAWLLSLLMLVMGYIIIWSEVSPYLNW